MVFHSPTPPSKEEIALASAQNDVSRKEDVEQAISKALIISELSRHQSMYGYEADRQAVRHHTHKLLECLYRLKG